MSYIINKTDGTVLSTTNMPSGVLLDGTSDSSTGVTLFGRNYPSYGDAQNENFVHLLENFAASNPPTQSLTALSALRGTLWYDTTAKKIKVYDGTNWNLVGGSIVSAITPASDKYTLNIGDQWWNTNTHQLSIWNGTAWALITSGTDLDSTNSNVAQLAITSVSYTDASIAQLNLSTSANILSNISQVRSDTSTYIASNVSTINSKISQLRSDTSTYIASNVAAVNSNVTALANTVANNYATTDWVVAALTGSPTLTSATLSDSTLSNSTLIDTTLSGNIIVTSSIIPVSNVAIDLGNSTHWFNTLYGKSSQAQYADLAEKYLPDAEYEVGTVVVVGGNAEITACAGSQQRPIGVISENPAYKMNSLLEGGVYVALKGRVPVQVTGTVRKGDKLVAGPNGTATVKVSANEEIFAIALETNTDTGVTLVEAVIL